MYVPDSRRSLIGRSFTLRVLLLFNGLLFDRCAVARLDDISQGSCRLCEIEQVCSASHQRTVRVHESVCDTLGDSPLTRLLLLPTEGPAKSQLFVRNDNDDNTHLHCFCCCQSQSHPEGQARQAPCMHSMASELGRRRSFRGYKDALQTTTRRKVR